MNQPASVFDRITASLTEPASFRALALALFLPLLALYFPTSPWNGNEENYFQLAYRRVAPDAFSVWSAAFDHSNARVVGEWLFGGLVYLFGYESAYVVARVANAVLYATGIAAMFASVRMSIIASVSVVIIFHLLGEQILGGDWLFNGTETKTIAYPLIFFAIAHANRGRWHTAFVLCAGATWFHFLAGGFWSFALGLCAAWQLRRQWPVAIRALGIYILLIAPLLAIVAYDQLAAVNTLPLPAIADVAPQETDRIYAVRNAHHVSPFIDPAIFPRWRRGLVALGVAMIVWVIAWRRRPSAALLLPLAGIGLVELALAWGISYFDQDRLALAKLYLFRPSSVTLFLLLGATFIAIRGALSSRFSALAMLALVLGTFASHQVLLERRRDRMVVEPPKTVPHQRELLEVVHASSAEGDVVLLDPALDRTIAGITLHRLVDRPTVVALKFVPTAPPEIQRWYTLLRWRERLYEKGCAGGTAGVPVKLIVTASQSARERVADCGTLVWQRDDMAVIRVSR